MPLRVTVDTNVVPIDDLRRETDGISIEFAAVTVTVRELEDTRRGLGLAGLEVVPETLVIGEGRWGEAALASPDSSDRLALILRIISNGSWARSRELTHGQRSQLRDALVFEAHVRDGRDILVSDDATAFINYGRREELERVFETRIFRKSEFLEFCRSMRRS